MPPTQRRRERGAVAVEMALILPLLLLVIGGIVDFGRLLFTQNIVTNAAREGARMRSLGYPAGALPTPAVGTATHRVVQAMNGVPDGSYTVTFSADCPSSPLPSDSAVATVQVTGFRFIFPLPVTAPQPSAEATMRCGG